MTAADFEAEITRDDGGRIVAEVWHKPSGKTIGITEVETFAAGKWWAEKLIADTIAKDETGEGGAT